MAPPPPPPEEACLSPTGALAPDALSIGARAAAQHSLSIAGCFHLKLIVFFFNPRQILETTCYETQILMQSRSFWSWTGVNVCTLCHGMPSPSCPETQELEFTGLKDDWSLPVSKSPTPRAFSFFVAAAPPPHWHLLFLQNQDNGFSPDHAHQN